jgi:hypothetical protein
MDTLLLFQSLWYVNQHIRVWVLVSCDSIENTILDIRSKLVIGNYSVWSM